MLDDDARRRLQQSYFSGDLHERAIVDRLPMLLAGARSFVDVGASLGQYSFNANRILSNARIVAVEADAARHELLAESCREWARTSTNELRAVHAAVTDEDAPQTFFVTDSATSGGLFRHDVKSGAQVAWREVSCPGVTLDTLCPDEPPDVVKIDVEGSELRVLRGAERILAAGRTAWLIELHGWGDPETGATWRDVVAFMVARRYLPAYFHGSVLFARPGPKWVRALLSGAPSLARRLARAVSRRAGRG